MRKHRKSEQAGGRKSVTRESAAANLEGVKPPSESIVSEKEFRSPKGRVYRIIRTTEVDAYEESPAKQRGGRSRKRS